MRLMELGRGQWRRAGAQVHRAARVAALLRWGSALVPVVVWLAFPGLFLEAVLATVVLVVLLPRLVLRLGTLGVVDGLQA